MIADLTSINVAVEGEGYLRFVRAGTLVYARRASLSVVGGVVVGPAGAVLAPKVVVPSVATTQRITVEMDGTIRAGSKTMGRITLAVFSGPGTTGKPRLVSPGEGTVGIIRTTAAVATPKISDSKVGKTRITVRASAQIEGPRILLGDIAEIAAAPALKAKLIALDLGTAPPLGTTRGIGQGYVRSLIRGLGLKPEAFDLVVPPGATVAQSGVVVSAQAILDAALAAGPGIGLVPNQPIVPLTVPPGALELVAEGVSRSANGTSVTVSAKVGGKPAGRRTITLVLDPNAPAAKTGDAVRLKLMTGGAEVEVAAKIKTGGRVGGQVTVLSSTGSVHTGILVTPTLVEVKL